MADDHDSSGGAPSTDDMLNALASEVSGKKTRAVDEGATTVQETVTPQPEDGEAPEAADEPDPEEASEGEPESEAAEESAQTSKKSAPRSSTGEIKDATAIFGISQDDVSLDDIDFDEPVDDDMLGAPAGGGRMIGIVLVLVILGGIAVFLGMLGQKRMSELEDAHVLVDSWVEVLTLYDVHQEDIKQYKIKQHNKAERAKVPIYGNLRIESEPEMADVYLECQPPDGHCNNVGTKEAPRWDSHWVRDEETKEKKCVRDEDCRECRTATAEEMKEEGFDPRALCSIYDAKCQAGQCYLPIRTATTMQSLYVGTLAGLDPARRYTLTLKKAGWLDERYEVGAKDWTQQAIPGRDDSDRTFVKRFEFKPDPMAPPEIKAKVDAYLKEKEEAAAAMMKEMEAWEASGN